MQYTENLAIWYNFDVSRELSQFRSIEQLDCVEKKSTLHSLILVPTSKPHTKPAKEAESACRAS